MSNPTTETLEQVINRAAGELPEEWLISIEVERGSGIVRLTEPDGESVDFECADRNLAEQVSEAIAAAIELDNTK